jgi:hypothetical protein
MRLCLVGLAVAGMALGMLGGCGRGAKVAVPLSGMEIAPDFGPTVDVTNFRGSVTVIADERAVTPSVSAKVRPLDRTFPMKGKELAAKANITADSGLEGGRRLLRVVSTPTGSDEVAVDLVVRVARTEGVRVRNTGGTVELVRVLGPITVINGVGGASGGDIVVRTGEVMTDHVTLTTTEGDVVYQVGPGSTGAYYLETDSGSAYFNAQMGTVTHVRPEPSKYRGVLNGGDNPITLRSGKGDVRAAVLENAGTYMPDMWGNPTWPKYPKPIGRLGGYHNDEPLFRKKQPAEPMPDPEQPSPQ